MVLWVDTIVHFKWLEPKTRNQIAASEVLEGLDSLKPDQREMVIAKVWGELTFEELAEKIPQHPILTHSQSTKGSVSCSRCSWNPMT
ncbi:MAG: hypothetical protein DWI26_06935 [Planctomycetota bacterium]|nr:MAG: hypothetical protein DWH99_03565 [Planctomycetota bacterium]RLT14221.1 MAG: hypothetical protein DWI26_06935 [Planctomycetota bacterium]